MSQIKIDLDLVGNLNSDLNRILSKLSNVKSSFSSIENHVDSAIAGRRGIRSRLNCFSHVLHEMETRIREIESFIRTSVESYNKAERVVITRVLSIGEKSKPTL